MGHIGRRTAFHFMTPQGTAVYSGEYRHALDDKNRLTIPSPWRSMHADGSEFLAVPRDGAIVVLSPSKVAHIVAKADTVPISNTKVQDALKRFFSSANKFSFDKQGRMTVTDAHRQYANIGADAVLVAAGTNFAIYNPDVWVKLKAAKAEEDDQALADFGI